MAIIKIYKFFKISDICFRYLISSNINNFMFVYCSEQNKSYSSVETLPMETNETLFKITSSITNSSFKPCVQELTNSSHGFSKIDLPCMDEMPDTQSDASLAMNLSNQDNLTEFLSIYSSKDLSVNSFEGLLNYLSQDTTQDYEMLSNNQSEGDNVRNSENDKNLNTLPNKQTQHVTTEKFVKKSLDSTPISQHTETPVVSKCNIEGEQNNLNFDRPGNSIDIYSTSSSTNYLSNSLSPKVYIPSSVMEIMATGKNDSNTHVELSIDKQHRKELFIKRHIKNVNKLKKIIIQMSKVFNSNTNSRLMVKPSSSHITDTWDENTSFLANCLTKAAKQKMIKDIKQLKTFRPIIFPNTSMFPKNLKELLLDTVYNLNIRIFPYSINTKRFFEKAFVLKTESISVYKNIAKESCSKITYSISFIPKFFIPEFYEGNEILSVEQEYVPKLHHFYYIMKRTIELRNSEELQRIHLVPVLKPNQDKFWRRKYVDVIKRWQYRFLNLKAKRKRLIQIQIQKENMNQKEFEFSYT